MKDLNRKTPPGRTVETNVVLDQFLEVVAGIRLMELDAKGARWEDAGKKLAAMRTQSPFPFPDDVTYGQMAQTVRDVVRLAAEFLEVNP